jgi:SNF2 family DNA or RNA helicase
MTVFAEVDTVDNNKVAITGFQWMHTELLKALPSAQFNKKGDFFTIAKTWPTCLALANDFPGQLQIGPKLNDWMAAEYGRRIAPAFAMRDVTSSDVGYERLFPHQRADVQFLATAERAILANGLGSGKTQSVFSTVRWLGEQMEKDVFPVLVICPNSTKFSWAREIEQVWPGLRVTVIDGSATQRAKQFAVAKGGTSIPCPVHAPVDVVEAPKPKSKKKPVEPVCMCGSHVVVINWDALRHHSRLKAYGHIALKKCPEHGGLDTKVKASACEVHPKELNGIDFKLVIADEAHRMIDPSSKVARAAKAAAGKARYRYALTGTPISSTPDDLFSILNFLDPEAYPSKVKYLARYCETHFDAWGNTVVSGIKNDKRIEFFQGLDPILRRMPKEVILPFLPPVLRVRRDVELSAKQQKAYTQMQEQMIAELNGEVISTTSPLVKMTRMLQLASAYGEVEYRQVVNKKTKKLEEKAFVRLSDPSCKLDALMEDLPDYGEDSLVIFTVSSQLANMLSARLTKAGHAHGLITGDQDAMERQRHMDNFQNGLTKYIVVTVDAGGTGITLTKARVAVFLQRSWSMIVNLQAEGRVHRIGSEQHESIQIVDYVATGTSEETVFDAIEQKGRSLQEILRDKALIDKFVSGQKIDVSQFPIEEDHLEHDAIDFDDVA